MPSCRFRAIRRRVSSLTVTIRARDAIRLFRAWTLEIELATRWVKSVQACLRVGRQDVGGEHHDHPPRGAEVEPSRLTVPSSCQRPTSTRGTPSARLVSPATALKIVASGTC